MAPDSARPLESNSFSGGAAKQSLRVYMKRYAAELISAIPKTAASVTIVTLGYRADG
jgi:hypothetical protein